MKINKKLLISFIVFFAFIALSTKVQAASASISASSTNVKPGTKVTITTKIKGASWQVHLSGAVSATYSDSTSDAEDTTKTEKTTFTPKKEGTYKVTLSGNVTGSTDSSATPVSGTVTITVKEKNNNTNNNNTTDNNTTTVSTDATLKNLGIKPNDFGGFRKGITSYSVSVPKNVDKVSIYATPSNSKATVSGIGSKSLQIGKNTFNIKVTAEDKKTTKTYSLIITRKSEDENASDATLKNLGIRPKEYDFTGFKPSNTSYNVSVPNDVEKITIYASTKSDKATVTGLGSKTLQVGANRCEIMVTSENKKATKTYVINITRKEKEEKPEEKTEEKPDEDENSGDNKIVEGLKNIEIKDIDLSPSFSQDEYSYKVSVPSGTEKLDIQTETTSDNIEVEIAGNENLKQGQNVITLLVHNKKNDTTSTYQINATVGNQAIDLSTVNKELKDAESNAKKQEWIIKGTIITIVVLIIIYLIQRYKITHEQEDDDEYEEYEEDTEEYYEPEYQDTNSSTSDDLRKIGLFDDTQRIEFDEQIDERQKKHGKYKGRRFK